MLFTFLKRIKFVSLLFVLSSCFGYLLPTLIMENITLCYCLSFHSYTLPPKAVFYQLRLDCHNSAFYFVFPHLPFVVYKTEGHIYCTEWHTYGPWDLPSPTVYTWCYFLSFSTQICKSPYHCFLLPLCSFRMIYCVYPQHYRSISGGGGGGGRAGSSSSHCHHKISW